MQKGVAAGQSQGSAGSLEITTPQVIARTPGAAPAGAPGLEFERFFSREGIDPFDEIEWEMRSAVIGNEKGELVFEQRDVEIPRFWSQQATNIVVSKYFRGQIGTPEREKSVKQLIGRVVDTITDLGARAAVLRERRRPAGLQRRSEAPPRLPEGRVQQPGVVQRRLREASRSAPPASSTPCRTRWSRSSAWRRPRACCSSTGRAPGSNLSNIRSSKELLAGGGTASGPVSFMKGFDAFAGVIKSGGKTRRAAKMVILNADHPGRRGVHQLQGRGREEGVGADRRRLRRLVHRPGLCLGVLPELEQQRARDRRVHARGDGRRRVADPGGAAAARGHRRPTRRAT